MPFSPILGGDIHFDEAVASVGYLSSLPVDYQLV